MLIGAWLSPVVGPADATLLNASHDPTRELYREINAALVKQWKEKPAGTLHLSWMRGWSPRRVRVKMTPWMMGIGRFDGVPCLTKRLPFFRSS